MKIKRCANCDYADKYPAINNRWYCTNVESKMVGEYIRPNGVCDKWEKRRASKNGKVHQQ